MRAGNRVYESPGDLPEAIPMFPLAGVLLLPGAQLPLNIFEPRFLAMMEAAMAGDRIIGMIQPEPETTGEDTLCAIGCAGRIVSFAESGDGRYLVTLHGISRFRVTEELEGDALFRTCRVDFSGFASDLKEGQGDQSVDRAGLLRAFRAFLEAHELDADWETVGRTPTGALVNALSMMSPYGPAEKQALLEAPDLKARAETLVAITEMSLATGVDGKPSLQ